MDFLQKLDQLSDDSGYEEPNPNSHEYQLQFYQKPCHSNHSHRIIDFHGIKTVDVANDYSFDGSHNTVNDQFTEQNISSNITNHTSEPCPPLIPTSVLSDKGRTVFNFQHFNKMQSKAFASIYQQDHNCVISSPTGSGKTVLFELAILRLMKTNRDVTNIKILYIAPTKALCLEREKDWVSKFSSFGLSVGVLTSDTSFVDTDKVKKANIIITTPEKWDLMTRKWADYNKLFEMIKILLIDEIHILKENRGSTLEVVVTRMKKICTDLRIVAVSATVPNIKDISAWIKLNSLSPISAITLVFGDDYRPVKLQKVVYGYKQTSNDFMFDSFLNSKIIEILSTHSNGKPVMIFCPTRPSCASTANFLFKNLQSSMLSQPFGLTLKDKDLIGLTKEGIAYHHAGMSMEDRNSIEQGFKNGCIKILCSTSTLAVGVNLPAYLVIVKGTKMWKNISFEEYSELDILQMMGRAGRPQFETEGKAVIMTSQDRKEYYESLVKGNNKLESKLHLNLYENLTSEVFLNTITSLQDALTWLKHTFFYARYHSNPTAYDEIPYIPNSDIDGRLMHYCELKIRELIDFKVIEVSGGSYRTTPYGDAMTRHYIAFDTMKLFIRCEYGQSVASILEMVSKAKEFESIRLKRSEKKLFKSLNSSPILKFPVNTSKNLKIEMSSEKISLLIQYELGGLEFPSDPDLSKLQHSFKQDRFFVFKHVHRLLKCSIDCFVEKNDYISLKNCLYLYRSINSNGWEDSSMVLKQLSSVGLAYVRRFANHNISSFEQIQQLTLNQLEYYLGMRPGQGIKIKSQVDSLPKLFIQSEIVKSSKSKNADDVLVRVKITIRVEGNGAKWNGKNLTLNVVCGLSTGKLINYRRSPIAKILGSRSFVVDIPLVLRDSLLETTISIEELGGVGFSATLPFVDFLPNSLCVGLRTSTARKNDLCEIEDDDDDLDDLMIEASTKKLKSSQKMHTDASRIVLPSGNLQCRHTCKDKTKCRHLCCREGLPPPKHKQTAENKRQKETQESKDSENSCGINLLKKLHTNNAENVGSRVSKFSTHNTSTISASNRTIDDYARDSRLGNLGSSPLTSKYEVSKSKSSKLTLNSDDFKTDIEKLTSESSGDDFDVLTLLNKRSIDECERLNPTKTTNLTDTDMNMKVYEPLQDAISVHSEDTDSSCVEITNETTASIKRCLYDDIENVNHEIQAEKHAREELELQTKRRKVATNKNTSAGYDLLPKDEFQQELNEEDMHGLFGSDVEII